MSPMYFGRRPPGAVDIALSSPQEFTRTLKAGGTASREGMVDDAGRAERLQAPQIADISVAK